MSRRGRYWPVENTVHQRAMQPIPVPPDMRATGLSTVLGVWQSRDFLAVLWDDRGHHRLSVNRTTWDQLTSTWRGGITWDDLMRIKAQCGFSDVWAIEIYPPETQVVNVSAMRHLWLLDAAPAQAWTWEAP